MSTRLQLDEVRSVEARDGIWQFFPRRQLTSAGSEAPRSSLLAAIPGGRVIDIDLPVGVDISEVPDAELVQRGRRALMARYLMPQGRWAHDYKDLSWTHEPR